MTRTQLLQQRRDLLARMHEMNARSQQWAGDDQKNWDAMTAQVRDIDAQLKRMDELEAMQGGEQSEGSQTRAAVPSPTSPSGAPPAGDASVERARASDILQLCRQFDMDPQPHIDGGSSVEAVRKLVLEELGKRNAPLPGAPRANVGDENVDKFREAGSDAIIMRAGLDISRATREHNKPYQAFDGAREMMHMGMHGMMREYCQLRGVRNVHRLTVDELRREVFTPDSQFAAMLDNTANKSMMIGYNDAGVTFDIWTRPGSNPDFKPTRRYRLSEAGTPKKILQNGEFKHDTMSDERVQLQLETYGITFTLSRQAIINDDLSYLTLMPAAYVRGFRRLINRNVYGLLNNNTAYQVDNVALFDAAHGNLGTAAYPARTPFDASRARMRKQKNIRNDETINIGPKYVLSGADLEGVFELLLYIDPNNSFQNAGISPQLRNSLELVVDAELTSNTGGNPDWFLSADPRQVDTIEVAYLNGNSMPTLESQMSFEQLGMAWRLYGDWDIDILDYRGLDKTPGAAAPA